MFKRIVSVFLITLIYLPWAQSEAKDISGIHFADTVEVNGQKLWLNGVGKRKKFFVTVYAGALYLPKKTNIDQEALNMPGPKRVVMHFVYRKVRADQINETWDEDFKNNLSDEERQRLAAKIEAFKKLFRDVQSGDEIILDFIPGQGIVVHINDQLMGSVNDDHLAKVVLLSWLGPKPGDENLKKAMLGQE